MRLLPVFLVALIAACGDSAAGDPTDTASDTADVAGDTSVIVPDGTADSDIGPSDGAADSDVSAPDTTTDPDSIADTTDPDPATVPIQTEFDSIAAAPKCKDVDDGTNCVEAAPNAIRIDDESNLKWKRADFDKENQILRFELMPGATLGPRFVKGAYIYRGRKDREPMMHRIEEVRVDGQNVGIQVSDAKLKDVFPRGRIRTRIPLVEPPANPLAYANAIAIGSIGIEDCSGTVLNVVLLPLVNGATGTVKLDLTSCKFVLTAWVDAVLLWDNIINLDKVEFVLGGSAEASLHAALEVAANASASGSTTIWAGFPLFFVVAGVPITLTPQLIAGWSVDAAAALTVEAGFDYFSSIELGMGWSDPLKWYTIYERQHNFTAFGPNVYFDGSIEAEVYLKPRVNVAVLGLLNGFVALKTFAASDLTSTASIGPNGNYQGEVCVDLDVGVTPSVGATASVAGFTVFEEEVNLVTFLAHLVQDLCFDWSGPPPSDCAAESECCVDAECPADEDPEITVTCEPGAGNGDRVYACEYHYPEDYCTQRTAEVCDDDLFNTTDSCIDNRCVNDADLQEATDTSNVAPNCGALPDCCYTRSDCLDGNRLTNDACVKPNLNDGPEVRGTCTHTVLQAGG